MDFYLVFGLVAAVALGILAVTMSSRQKKWYIVYLANNDIMLLSRDLNDRWWRTSTRYMRFKDEMGREVTFPAEAHWILMWREVRQSQLNDAREEIQRHKEQMAKESVDA